MPGEQPRRELHTHYIIHHQLYIDMAQTQLIEEALSPHMLSQLVQVLSKLASGNVDNNQRAATEEELNHTWLMQQPGLLLSGLANIARSHPDPTVSKTCRAIELTMMWH